MEVSTNSSLWLSTTAFGATIAGSILLLSWRREVAKQSTKTKTTKRLLFTSTLSMSSPSSSTTHDDSELDSQSRNSNRRRRLLRHLSTNSTKWSNYTEQDEMFIQNLPKIELHVHLDGSLDAEYVWNYIQEHPDSIYCLPIQTNPPWQKEPLYIRQKVMDCTTSKEFVQLCTCRGYRSLSAMLNCFEIFLPILRNQLPFIEQISYDFVIRQHTQNIVYTEVRYSPYLLIDTITNDKSTNNNGIVQKNSITAEMVVQAVTQGLRRGCAKYNNNIIINQILCCISWRPEWAMGTLDLVCKYQNDFPCAIVGIDIAAGEEHFDSKQYPHLFQSHYNMAQEAKRRNVPITLHAGEIPTDDAIRNVERAITEYGATRIGHGYRMINNTKTMELVRTNNVHVEVCPTSSVETGGWIYDTNLNGESRHRDWTNHPAVTMLQNDISIGINSDDPGVFHTSLSWQYRIAFNKMLLSYTDIIQMNINAIYAAWCSKQDKDCIMQLLHSYANVHGIGTTATEIENESDDTDFTMRSDIICKSWYSTKTSNFYDRVYLSYDDDDSIT